MEKHLHILLLVVSLALTARPADGQGIINTIAGSTFLPFSGNGGPAVNATLGTLSGVAVDPAGNIYAFDSENNYAIRITPAGLLAIVAGNGTSGFSGDGGPATNAAFGYPPAVSSLAVDAAGNFFIPDAANNRIRKVVLNGTMSTVAGDGTPEFSGDGGPATRASLNRPNGVAVDASGNLFIADGGNYRIRKVTPDGIISTLAGLTAGSSSSGQYYPTGIAVDSAGSVFALVGLYVRKASPDGVISVVAGNGKFGSSGDGGPATAAAMNPTGVAVDAAGNVFIADDNRIRKIGRDGIIWTVAGDGIAGFSGDGGPATGARFNLILGLAADSAGNLLIADSRNRRIRRITLAGAISTVAGNGLYYFGGDGGPATAAWLHLSPPGGVAVDSLGNLFIADTTNNRVRKVATDGVISTVAGDGRLGFSGDGGPATGASIYPTSIAVDSGGNLFIAEPGNNRVRKVARDGTISTVAGRNSGYYYSGDGGPATAADLHYPSGVAVDGAGNLFIADKENYRVRKVTPDGAISTVAGIGSPAGWNPYGPPWSIDGVPATASGVYADAVAVDSKGNLFIAGSDRVRKVSPGGIITTIAGGSGNRSVCPGDRGPATLAALSPVGIGVDAAGSIFVADNANNRVRRVAPAGTIWTVAGNGSAAFSGDGGPATRAGLSAGAVAVDNAGNLFIADTVNNRVRKVLNPIDSADVPCVPPAPQFGARLQNGANYSWDIAAGSFASLYASNLNPDLPYWGVEAAKLPLPASLGDVTVRLNGIAAPLLYVSSSQVNLLVPWELIGQNPIYVDVTVKGVNVGTGTDNVRYFTLKRAAPGVFFVPARGGGLGAVQIANSSLYAWPVGGVALVPSRPANRGEYVTIWCTGLGDVANRPPSGAAASSNPLSVTLATPTVTIGGKPAAVGFSGLAPGFAGLYQINAQVPADAPTGSAVPLTVTQAGVQGNTVVIAVQ